MTLFFVCLFIKTMTPIKVKENSKQAKLFLEYIKKLSFVEFMDVPLANVKYPSMNEIVEECKKSKKNCKKLQRQSLAMS